MKPRTDISVLSVLCLALVACGGGGGGGNGTGTTGDKPAITTQAVDNASSSGGTLHGLLTSSEPATALFEADDDPNFGSPVAINVPGTFSGTNVSVTTNWTGGLSGLPYYIRLRGTNSHGTSTDNGVSFKTYAVAVTGVADNIVDNNVRFNGTISSAEPAPVEIRWGSDPTLSTHTPISVGNVSGLNQAVSAPAQTPSPATYYYQVVVEPGSVREQRGAILPFRNDGTISGSVGRSSRLKIYVNAKLIEVVTGGSVNPVNFSISCYAGDVQFSHAYGVNGALEREYAVQDATNNNMFRLNPGGSLNVPYPSSYDTTTNIINIPITGSNYVPSYEAPGLINGNWNNCILLVTDSNLPPPQPQIGDNYAYTMVYNQNPSTPNRVEISIAGFANPIIGNMNGRILTLSGFNPTYSWRNIKHLVLSADGSSMTGSFEEYWTDGTFLRIAGNETEQR